MSTHENDGDRVTQPPEQETLQTLPQVQDAGRTAGEQRPTVHESDIFPPASGSRYFGTGSYEMGGTHAEGSDAVGDLNPLGGYGTFNDAGGPGSTALYGEDLPAVSGAPADDDATETQPQPPGTPT
jgi:hypothetical protein